MILGIENEACAREYDGMVVRQAVCTDSNYSARLYNVASRPPPIRQLSLERRSDTKVAKSFAIFRRRHRSKTRKSENAVPNRAEIIHGRRRRQALDFQSQLLSEVKSLEPIT